MYGETLGILTIVAFALGFVMARNIRYQASPIFQNAIRSITSLIVLIIICIFSGFFLVLFQVSAELWLVLIGSILLMVIFGDSLALKSQNYLDPAKTLSITTISPFLTIAFSVFFLNRPLSFNLIISGIFISLGVIIINYKKVKGKEEDRDNQIIEEKDENVSRGSLIGTIMALLAAVSWSIGIILTDYSMNQINTELNIGIMSTIIGLTIRYLFASLVLGIIALKVERKQSVPRTSHTWSYLLVSALISSALGSILFAESARTAGAVFLSLINTAIPLFTIPFSYLINKEKIKKMELIGILIILMGVLIVLFT